MKKNTFKKIASCLLVIAMGLSLAACGEEQQENRIEATTIADIDPIVDPGNDPNWEINTGRWISTETTEAPTEPVTEKVTEPVTEIVTEVPATTEVTTSEPAPEGKYSYTIYGGITLAMDVNVDEWINHTDENIDAFTLKYLAESLGWEVSDDSKFAVGPPQYYYKTDEVWVSLKWDADHTGIPVLNRKAGRGDKEMNQLSHVTLKYHKPGDLSSHYYEYSPNSSPETFELEFDFPTNFEKDNYIFAPSKPISCLSYDEIVLLCYLLWQTTQNPGKNAAYVSGCYDDFRQVCHLTTPSNGFQVIEILPSYY